MDNIDEPSSPVSALIAKLAQQLHQKGEHELRIVLPPDAQLNADSLPPNICLVDGQLEFLNTAARNEIVAAAVVEQFRDLIDFSASALFNAAHELWGDEIGHSDQASGRLLGLMADRFDIFEEAASLILAGARAYDVLHLVEAAIPYLKSIKPESIIALVTASHAQTKNDMMGNPTIAALEVWLRTKTGDALALRTQTLLCLGEETKVLLVIATIALSTSDYVTAAKMAREDYESPIQIRAEAGMWSLGRLLLVEEAPKEALRSVEATVLEAMNTGRAELKRHAIAAATGAMHKFSAFDSALERLAEQEDQDVLTFVASVIFFKSAQMRERGLTERWLQLLTKLKPEYIRSLRDLDFAMSRLLAASENSEIVISTLAQWTVNFGQKVAVDSRTAELFDDTAHELIKHEEQWSLFVTEWLLSDQIALPRALAGFLNQVDNSRVTLKLDKESLDSLSTSELLFLARRLLGYVHDRGQLTALALSLLQTRNAEERVYALLRELLVSEIGYDYPGSTIEALEAAAKASVLEEDKSFLLKAAGEIDEALSARSALPRLNELQPSPKLRRLFARARGKQMEAGMEKAQEKSVFNQIATRIPIKAGAGTFNYRSQNFDQPLKLSTFSYSIELPRREAFDPIGNAIRHFQFRNAKKGDQ